MPVLLAALGLVTIARLSSDLAHRQEVLIAISLALAMLAGPAFARFRRFAAYKYIWVLGTVALFGMVAVFGQEVNGAKLWIRIGPIQYEPVEIIKLLIVLFMAAYLAETGDVIADAKPWSLRANAKYLGPLIVGWGASMAILVFERDIGMATLLLATFAAMLYVATRRVDLIAGGAALFRARGVVGEPPLSVRRGALRGVARSLRRPARSRLSSGAGAFLARRRRTLRHGLRARSIPGSFRPSPPTTCSRPGAKSSERWAASC